jgi:hypothetical protein
MLPRLIVALLALAVVSCLAQAGVLDLLSAGLDARKWGDLDAAVKFYTGAISAGGLSDADLALVLGSSGVTFGIKG